MKLTGRNGVLRINDGQSEPMSGYPIPGQAVNMMRFTSPATYDDITTSVYLYDAAGSVILGDADDIMYVGCGVKFARVQYAKTVVQNYGAGTGALIAKYWNGTAWATLEGVVDGTASGGACFAQAGYISFKIPRNWASNASSNVPSLTASRYYISLQTTTDPATDPGADLLCPCGEQYYEVAFATMDFSGPLGRKLQDEILVLDRNTMSAKGHYIKSADDPLYEPIPISFSCMIDDTYNKTAIMEALACGNPASVAWDTTGNSSKGATKNDGVYNNPAFADTNKKCVNIQILWSGATYGIGMAFYECYFPEDEITIAESEDAITLSASGGCYGVIETINGFGNRY